MAGADVVLGGLVEEEADVRLQVAAALAHEAARPAAGAVRDGDGVGVVHDAVDLLVGAAARVVVYGHLDGDDAHHALADGDEGGQRGNALARVLLEALGYDGVLLAHLLVADHHLHDARHPDGHVELVHAVLFGEAADAELGQLVEHLRDPVERLFDLLGDLLGRHVVADAQAHGDLGHLVRQHGVEDLVFGVVRRDAGVGAAFEAYFRRKLQDNRSHLVEFPLFFIFRYV